MFINTEDPDCYRYSSRSK